MITSTLHLLACIVLAGVALYWRHHAGEGASIYRQVFPFVVVAGFFGLLILYRYVVEFFVASYSGAIYESGGLTAWRIAWIAVSVFLTLLPLVGLIPNIGERAISLIVIGCLAAIPSALSLVPSSANIQEAEQDVHGNTY